MFLPWLLCTACLPCWYSNCTAFDMKRQSEVDGKYLLAVVPDPIAGISRQRLCEVILLVDMLYCTCC